MSGGFPCTGCGVCCRSVGRTLAQFRATPERWRPVEQDALAAFPYGVRLDGACEQLGEDGRCQVYLVRPLVCRVDAMSAARGWSREEARAITTAACDALQDEAGIARDDVRRVPRGR